MSARDGEVNARERMCKACEGTGVEECPGVIECGRGGAFKDHTCLACAGSGRVSERIPASDAVADAETLRKIYRTHYRAPKIEASVFLPDRDMPAVVGWKPVQEVTSITYHVARAAFRAVPGLKG